MFLTCHYFSHILQSNTEINVIIPTPVGNEQITDKESVTRYRYEEGLPVVYLLHGAYGDNSSWSRFSSIERYAQAHNCVAVMASAENSFYQDMAHGKAYFRFFTEELVEYIRALFPVSKKREDTMIAGLSMGGYGAWYLALKRPDLFSKAASMSGAVDIAACYAGVRDGDIEGPFMWNSIFENPETLNGSEADLFALAQRDLEQGTLPVLHQSCGTKDFLIEMNRNAYKKLTGMGVQVIYEEVPEHMHNWDFWDLEIQKILDWMLPEEKR
jgi:S-formylglutathione hydrolase FrmB